MLLLKVVFIVFSIPDLFVLSLQQRMTRTTHQVLNAGNKDLGGDQQSRVLFALTENFGRLISAKEQKKNQAFNDIDKKHELMTFEQVASAIREEYEKLFWVTGEMDITLWADDCFFADPFSSFGGEAGSTARFEKNAKNLGKLVLNPKSRITSFEADEENCCVSIGWTFSSKLALPWKPVLAASGVTSHYLNKDTLLIEKYFETWKSKPFDVVKRIFVPSLGDE